MVLGPSQQTLYPRLGKFLITPAGGEIALSVLASDCIAYSQRRNE